MPVYTQEYNTPLDIMNRALQIIGQPMISAIDEDSRAATECAFAYDKVREAELRRNTWSFATKRTAIRPIDSTTMLFEPVEFDPTATSYAAGSIIARDNETWQNRLPITSAGLIPGNDPAWELYFGPLTALPTTDIGTDTFYASELTWITVSTVNKVYTSLVSSNAALVSDTTSWTLNDAVGLVSPALLYPLGAGPQTQSSSRNLYKLPCNFLRLAPQDPKAGSVSYLGAPSGIGYSDWEIDSGFLITRDVNTILLRFIADCTNVRTFDVMFCEGVAARLALAICEPLTQSSEKVKTCASLYKIIMGEARIANAILTGAVFDAEDDYITCRA